MLYPSLARRASLLHRPAPEAVCQAILVGWLLALAAAVVYAPLSIVGLTVLAGPGLCALWAGRRTSEILPAAVHHLVWTWLLAQGRSPGRMMLVGLAAAVAFGGLYWSMCTSAAQTGNIMFESPAGGQASILDDVLERPAPDGGTIYTVTHSSSRLVARRCMYFSVVTLATLGYGDYQPTGRAQWLAMAEAICGLLLLATLAASLVHKMDREAARP